MEEVKIKVSGAGITCSKGFLTVSANRNLAPSLEKFWNVLSATQSFAAQSISMLSYNATSLTLYVFGPDTVLTSKTFDAPPTEKEMEVALFGLLPDLLWGSATE